MTSQTAAAIAAAVRAALEAMPDTTPQTAAPELLTVRETCQRLNITRPTLYSLAERGELRFRKIGRSVRIRREEIDRLAGATA
jgi:excisionase family DNA binding protein